MVKSVWSEGVSLPAFKQLQGDKKTDVLIIGGGMCGVLCAYFLKLAGVDYMLVEASTIGGGVTQNTTAKITSQHGLIYHKLAEEAGDEAARMYLWANESALLKYRELAENIACDFTEKDAYTYSMSDRVLLEDEVRVLNHLGFPAEYVEHPNLPFDTEGAVKFVKQAQFHPLKFLAEIASGLNIYEHTFVKKVDGHTAMTDHGNITADNIIFATHFPFMNKHGSYFLKMYQHRSYVTALENAPFLDGMYVDEAQKGLSFRNYDKLLLIGGGDHKTGKQGGSWQELREFAKKYYPKATEKYHWATQDCMSLDGIPYIGQYSKQTPYYYVATGFNKWGMTSSMTAAMLLSDLILGNDNDWKEVYSPSRSMLKPQLLVNGCAAVGNLFTPTLKRCPHMGCALKWNKYEHTWDCPCHGSRFEEQGKLINNPAMKDADV